MCWRSPVRCLCSARPCHESEPLFDGCLTPPEEEGLPSGGGRGKEKGRSGEEEILLGGGGLVRSKFDGDGWRAEEGEGDD